MGKKKSAKSIGEAIGTLIAKVCYRAADELGEEFVKRTGDWRRDNALTILQKADQKYKQLSSSGDEHAPPRLVHHIIEEGSWSDKNYIQDMWAGLLASSCTDSGEDESNLIFVNILKQLTSLEVVILNYACKNCKKNVTEGGWLSSDELIVGLKDLVTLTGVSDLHRLDRELDHLRALELILKGFDSESTDADITPTALALQMYARCQGCVSSPVDFYGLSKDDSNAS